MSKIGAFSSFIYGHTVNPDNNLIDFDEVGLITAPEKTAELKVGSYSLTEYASEIKRAINVAGSKAYDVTVNRTTRKITIIPSSGLIGLRISGGSHLGTSAFNMMGFSSGYVTGASVTGDMPSGSIYHPQFTLQNYISSEDWQEAVDSVVNTTASGRVEVVKFGNQKFIGLKIRYANNFSHSSGPIRNNPSGVEDLRTYLKYATTKAPIEFVIDEKFPEIFETVILESTAENQKGTGYKLKELYDKGLPGYYETSDLKMRVIK